MTTISLKRLEGSWAISRLAPTDPVPAWADGPGFASVSRDDEELSVVCREERVPADVRSDRGWACFKFLGPFAFDQTGILLSVIAPLSSAGIGIFAVSSFDTDHLLVKREHLERTLELLRAAGHRLV